MIPVNEVGLTSELQDQLTEYVASVLAFREEGPLEPTQAAKLEEHFKASHIYHSAGIEGNRLTLQETVVVLQEGVDVSGKPLKDSMEVKRLGEAFDYLRELAASDHTIREADIRQMHQLLLSDASSAGPGEYRKSGVIISGSEHTPPEPLTVPARMAELVEWINDNMGENPVIVAAVAHHELAAIHPFLDGNGRVARLLMNLILMKRHMPICNIRREDRADYYETLSFADVGLFEPLVNLVRKQSAALFGEYVRIRSESKRMAEWADRWGTREAEVILRRESRELELFRSRMRQVLLEFQKAADLLNERLGDLEIEFYDYSLDLDLERYQRLREVGSAEHCNVFSINFRMRSTGHYERFMFRYFRNWERFEKRERVIPLEVNRYDMEGRTYVHLEATGWGPRVRVRDLYFSDEGQFLIQYRNPDTAGLSTKDVSIPEAVEWFFNDVLRNVFELK